MSSLANNAASAAAVPLTKAVLSVSQGGSGGKGGSDNIGAGEWAWVAGAREETGM